MQHSDTHICIYIITVWHVHKVLIYTFLQKHFCSKEFSLIVLGACTGNCDCCKWTIVVRPTQITIHSGNVVLMNHLWAFCYCATKRLKLLLREKDNHCLELKSNHSMLLWLGVIWNVFPDSENSGNRDSNKKRVSTHEYQSQRSKNR